MAVGSSDAAFASKPFAVLRRECAESRGRRRRQRDRQEQESDTRRQVRLRQQLAGWGPEAPRESENVRVLKATGSLPRALAVFGVTSPRREESSLIDDTARQLAAQVLRQHQIQQQGASEAQRRAWEEEKRRDGCLPRPGTVVLDKSRFRPAAAGGRGAADAGGGTAGAVVTGGGGGGARSPRRQSAASPAPGSPEPQEQQPDQGQPEGLVDPMKHHEQMADQQGQSAAQEDSDDQDMFKYWDDAYRQWNPGPEPPPPSTSEGARNVRGKLKGLIRESARRVALYRQGAGRVPRTPRHRPPAASLSDVDGFTPQQVPRSPSLHNSPPAAPAVRSSPSAQSSPALAPTSPLAHPAAQSRSNFFQLTQPRGDPLAATAPDAATLSAMTTAAAAPPGPTPRTRPAPAAPAPPPAPRLPRLKVVEVSALSLLSEADTRLSLQRADAAAPGGDDRRAQTARGPTRPRPPPHPASARRPQTGRPSASATHTRSHESAEDEDLLRQMTDATASKNILSYRLQRPRSGVRARARGVEYPAFVTDVRIAENSFLQAVGAEVERYGKERARVTERKREELRVSRQTWQVALARMVRTVSRGLERVIAAERRDTQRRYYDMYEKKVIDHFSGVLTRGARSVLNHLRNFFYNDDITIDVASFEALLDTLSGPQYLVNDTVSVLWSIKHIFRIADDRFVDALRERMRGVVESREDALSRKLLPSSGAPYHPLAWVLQEVPLTAIGPETVSWVLQMCNSKDGERQVRPEDLCTWLERLGPARVTPGLLKLSPEELPGPVAVWLTKEKGAEEVRRMLQGLAVGDSESPAPSPTAAGCGLGHVSPLIPVDTWLRQARQRAASHEGEMRKVGSRQRGKNAPDAGAGLPIADAARELLAVSGCGRGGPAQKLAQRQPSFIQAAKPKNPSPIVLSPNAVSGLSSSRRRSRDSR
eukprot:TRINITY_DN23672_c0_g1_i1.p1 TRINITY_DN23672_c0_g1~~TRINITY_DN23672_c0_g1_i1.p1  ORF type:complete len:934 (+),score=180.79 TRINITY_DN23672_c0_g1_i1:70-2871(+)